MARESAIGSLGDTFMFMVLSSAFNATFSVLPGALVLARRAARQWAFSHPKGEGLPGYHLLSGATFSALYGLYVPSSSWSTKAARKSTEDINEFSFEEGVFCGGSGCACHPGIFAERDSNQRTGPNHSRPKRKP